MKQTPKDKNKRRSSLEKALTAKIKNTKNDAFEKKRAMGYIDKSKPIRDFYLRIFLLSFIVVFFVVNMTFAFYRYVTIPESRYFLTTMDGKLHEITPQDVTKEQLIIIKRKHEATNEK